MGLYRKTQVKLISVDGESSTPLMNSLSSVVRGRSVLDPRIGGIDWDP